MWSKISLLLRYKHKLSSKVSLVILVCLRTHSLQITCKSALRLIFQLVLFATILACQSTLVLLYFYLSPVLPKHALEMEGYKLADKIGMRWYRLKIWIPLVVFQTQRLMSSCPWAIIAILPLVSNLNDFKFISW